MGPKSLDQKLTPKNFHAKSPNLVLYLICRTTRLGYGWGDGFGTEEKISRFEMSMSENALCNQKY